MQEDRTTRRVIVAGLVLAAGLLGFTLVRAWNAFVRLEAANGVRPADLELVTPWWHVAAATTVAAITAVILLVKRRRASR